MVVAGDPKQAPPVSGESWHKEEEYTGKGKNMPPKKKERTDCSWPTQDFVRAFLGLRDTFKDVVYLREVHRYEEKNDAIPKEKEEAFRADAQRFLEVCLRMADCELTEADYAWLVRRNRSVLEQTEEGRVELESFKEAPLLMDGRKDRVTGEEPLVGAMTVNKRMLWDLAQRTSVPIVGVRARHGRPDTAVGKKMMEEDLEAMDAYDFRGLDNVVYLAEGARVLLMQNLWVEAGLMNGALGYVRGWMWPANADPSSSDRTVNKPMIVFVVSSMT